jgi:hypothetical protein
MVARVKQNIMQATLEHSYACRHRGSWYLGTGCSNALMQAQRIYNRPQSGISPSAPLTTPAGATTESHCARRSSDLRFSLRGVGAPTVVARPVRLRHQINQRWVSPEEPRPYYCIHVTISVRGYLAPSQRLIVLESKDDCRECPRIETQPARQAQQI